ncbi:3'(2'),5'-bisphosphate nucleotidase [Hyphomonas neptunium ATCC 15444]|uniref:3'(2'),5'-bisphosphate nucleotidase CysQ n=2 Tax=Hyphomonas TaxID=85 RepID=Q0C5U0_HYPNA|nr:MULTISPECIES: 3'(2'),5'-bisphosphate nucleotidase CysQ [Hyphomonas]ABI77758.1 3'(2'),5'-bisphosphate nucleotidase [Hyphomonas neptunium ATCC 15444]KCZ89346.1 3'(2'),5'-bisphosphate nucleotidase [Hyphomonas hirschiana VP5]
MAVTADILAAIALAAGKEIMRVYRTDFSVSHKDDHSVLTEADGLAEAIILKGLAEAEPSLQVIAEEAVAGGHMPEHGARFALVDPLDGTKEFVAKNGEFTVNIAIIEHGRPVMGVVYVPAQNRLFVAEGPGKAWHANAAPDGPVPGDRTTLKVRPAPAAGLTAVASKSHRSPETDEWLSQYPVAEIKGAGSALKFCLVAAGEADVYPRLGRTMEWDTAAGQAVVEAAGGRVLTISGEPLLYGKRDRGYDNPHFVVFGDVTPH